MTEGPYTIAEVARILKMLERLRSNLGQHGGGLPRALRTVGARAAGSTGGGREGESEEAAEGCAHEEGGMTFGSLFAGAGGFDIGFAACGMRRIWEVELTRGRDIRSESGATLQPVELICGGPPCQATSRAAALRKRRTGVSLWPEMLRIVSEMLPAWVVVEQPLGGRDVIVQATLDLQRLGYGCAGRIIDSRHWVPQTRSRWFVIARLGVTGMALWNRLYPDGERMERGQLRAEAHAAHLQEGDAQSRLLFAGQCADCLPSGVYSRISARKPALIGAGNAVSPPVAEWIGRRIMEAESTGHAQDVAESSIVAEREVKLEV